MKWRLRLPVARAIRLMRWRRRRGSFIRHWHSWSLGLVLDLCVGLLPLARCRGASYVERMRNASTTQTTSHKLPRGGIPPCGRLRNSTRRSRTRWRRRWGAGASPATAARHALRAALGWRQLSHEVAEPAQLAPREAAWRAACMRLRPPPLFAVPSRHICRRRCRHHNRLLARGQDRQRPLVPFPRAQAPRAAVAAAGRHANETR